MIKLGSGNELRIEHIRDIVLGKEVGASDETLQLLRDRREQVVNHIRKTRQPAYGFNRGFGHNVDLPVDAALLEDLQKNLIRSHASGVGDPMPVEIVRAAMALRAHSLGQGYSGVRPEILLQLVSFLNNWITPVVPQFGSVGASGDLAPLSHIALALLGEGEVFFGRENTRMAASKALEKVGLKPLRLEMKEGLALNNGVQVSTAYGVLIYGELSKMLKQAAINTALSTQVMLGCDTAFDPSLHALRPHRGSLVVSKWIWDLMQNSPLRNVHREGWVDGEVQDPYSLRCAGQVLGACYDLIEDARVTLETEINSATDNPLMLEDPKSPGSFTRIVSGGHFHGMPIAVKLYNFLQAAGIMACLSNTRCVRFVDQNRNKGLGSDLVWPALSAGNISISSCMMIPEYVSAALTNFIWGECMPSHLMSLPTDAGQEDHVSMSAGLAVRAWNVLPRLAETLAIELAFGVQGAALRKILETMPSKTPLSTEESKEVRNAEAEFLAALDKAVKGRGFKPSVKVQLNFPIPEQNRKLSPVCESLVSEVQKVFPPVTEDRELSSQLQKLGSMVHQGVFVDLVEKSVRFGI